MLRLLSLLVMPTRVEQHNFDSEGCAGSFRFLIGPTNCGLKLLNKGVS